MQIQPHSHFLITRLSAIGDCIETLPLAVALKERYPNCKITWIVDCGVDSILKTQPSIDQVIRLKKGFLGKPREWLKLRKQMKSLRIDVSIDPQGLLKSAFLGRISGAQWRLGFSAPQSREYSWLLYNKRIHPQATHLVDRQIELLKPIIMDGIDPRFGWYEPDDVSIKCDAMLGPIQLVPKKYIIINSGAGWPSRRWPIDRFARVAKRIHDAFGLPSLLIWGGKNELEWANEIKTMANDACVIAPSTSLMEMSGLIKRSLLYLGGDTGPMHMSAAVGTPCVALFGTTRSEYSGPYGNIHHRLQKRFDSGSSKYRRNVDNAAISEITEEEVFEACKSVISHSIAR